MPRGVMLPAHSKLDMSLERSMVRSAASVLMKATSHSGTSGCHVMAGISAQNTSRFVTMLDTKIRMILTVKKKPLLNSVSQSKSYG